MPPCSVWIKERMSVLTFTAGWKNMCNWSEENTILPSPQMQRVQALGYPVFPLQSGKSCTWLFIAVLWNFPKGAYLLFWLEQRIWRSHGVIDSSEANQSSSSFSFYFAELVMLCMPCRALPLSHKYRCKGERRTKRWKELCLEEGTGKFLKLFVKKWVR